MGVYYEGPFAWIMTRGMRAAHNTILARLTRDIITPDGVSDALALSLHLLPSVAPALDDGVPPSLSMCLLGQAFAQLQIAGAALNVRTHRIVRLPWYRIDDILAAWRSISVKDVQAQTRWFNRFVGADPIAEVTGLFPEAFIGGR